MQHPLEPIARLLNFFAAFGVCPVKVVATKVGDSGTEVKLVPRRALFSAFSIALPTAVFVTAVALAFADGGEAGKDLQRVLEDMGHNTATSIITLGTFLILSPLHLSCCYLFQGTVLTALKELTSKTTAARPPPIADPDAARVGRRKALKHALTIALAFLVLLFLEAWIYFDYMLPAAARGASASIAAAHFLAFPAMLLASTPLYVIPLDLMVMAHLDFLKLQFETIGSEFQRAAIGKRSLERRLDHLLFSTRCVESFSSAFGRVLLIQVGISSIAEVIFFYDLSFISNLVQNFKVVPLLAFLTVVVASSASAWRKFRLFSLGQSLADSTRACLLALEDAVASNRISGLEVMGIREQQKLDILRARLADKEPIRPCGAFALTRGCLFGGYGLLITYSVVLVQYKEG